MKTKWISLLVFGAALSFLVAPGFTQGKVTHGETGLVGIKLYDTGMRLLQVYGNPDQILPIGAGGGGGGGGAAGGAPGGGRGGKFGSGGGGGGGGGAEFNAPYDFGDEMLLQNGSTDLRQAGVGGDGGGEAPIRGGKNGGGGGGGSRGGGAVAGAAQQYIRWTYNRNGCRYGFILDKNNRVVQIEAMGLANPKVRTRRGIGFGDSFKEVMERYLVPEGYQISGDTIVMRYLVRDKVAFRLNRLGLDKPHVVTAIVVAAGKT
ncbi:MAG: hypothetical protein QOJ65_1232 [Fimbriimonadaceae bacterium]|nr:hypothetical protein [Fimbriimonadaceae bacterium]